jgi:hypothetical protein
MKNTFSLFTLIIGLAFSMSVNAQDTYYSKKYPYRFTIMSGWKVKEQIFLPETDAKIVDGRGNSLIVSVKPIPTELRNRTVVSLLSKATDEDIAMSLSPSGFDNINIRKRGTTYIGNREFYYVFANEPFMDGLRLNHKLFYTNYKNNAYTIDCSSISSMTNEVIPYLDLMLESIRFF